MFISLCVSVCVCVCVHACMHVRMRVASCIVRINAKLTVAVITPNQILHKDRKIEELTAGSDEKNTAQPCQDSNQSIARKAIL